MYGAILGDIIGSRFEFDRGGKTKDFELLTIEDKFTDDSVMTVAVADALLGISADEDDATVRVALIKSMQKWGNRYPWAGYGQKFILWLGDKDPKPYGSWGNGSAMRVSSVGWLYNTMDETRRFARLSAEVSHNHPEGIKGAECTATVIFMARTGASKEEIAEYIDKEFAYDYSESLDEMRARHRHVESCQDSLPKALRSFFDGESYEDVVRNAVSLGGDTDTLAAIAGAMGEAFYGMPDELKAEAKKRVGEDMAEVMDRFDEQVVTSKTSLRDGFLDGKEQIEAAIDKFYVDDCKENLVAVLDAIRQRMHADGHFIHPVLVNEEYENEFAFRTLTTKDGKVWSVAFTSHAEYEKGEASHVMSNFIDTSMKFCMESKTEGFIINPWSQSFLLTKELMEMIFKADGGVEYTVPDILQSGDNFFFPVFTTAEEMGEYGDQFSKMPRHFLEAMILARNNEKNVKGIVINAFSEPFEIPVELFDIIAGMKSNVEDTVGADA